MLELIVKLSWTNRRNVQSWECWDNLCLDCSWVSLSWMHGWLAAVQQWLSAFCEILNIWSCWCRVWEDFTHYVYLHPALWRWETFLQQISQRLHRRQSWSTSSLRYLITYKGDSLKIPTPPWCRHAVQRLITSSFKLAAAMHTAYILHAVHSALQ